MKPGSKYYPLYDYLQRCGEEETALTFAEIEAMMGSTLPASARQRKNWWSNRDTASCPPGQGLGQCWISCQNR